MTDWLTVLFGTIGGTLISGIMVYIALKKLPLEMRGGETTLARDAYDLAQKAMDDRREDAERIDELETKIDTYEKTIRDNRVEMKLKDKRIEELERKVELLENMLASQRAEFEERLEFQKAEYDREILGYKTVVDDLDKQIEKLRQQVGAVKKTTDELKAK